MSLKNLFGGGLAGVSNPTLSTDKTTVSGSGVKPSSTVTVYKNGTQAGTSTANSSGAWSYSFGSALAPGDAVTYDAILTSPAYTVPTLPPGRRRSVVTARQGLPSWARSLGNGNNYTDIYQPVSFVLTDPINNDCIVTVGGYSPSTSTPMPADYSTTAGAVTLRYSIYDGTNTYPVLWSGNARELTLQPGQVVDSLPVAGFRGIAGQRCLLLRAFSWATPPANFPACSSPVFTSVEESQWGTGFNRSALVDSFSQIYKRQCGLWCILPPLAITGTPSSNRAVVAVPGDSIASDGVDTYNNNNPTYGGFLHGLRLAGIPAVNLGASSLALAQVMLAGNATALNQMIAAAQKAGCTHWLGELSTNDWGSGQTPSQVYANYQTLKNQLDAVGIKLILTTCPPHTGYATQVAAYNTLVRNGNGVGYGYYDFNTLVRGADDGSYRSDLRNAASVTIANAGSGYVSYAEIVLQGGIRVNPTSVGGNGAVTAVALSTTGYNNGAWLTDPTGPVGQVENTVPSAVGTVTGSGATFTVTAQAAGAGSNDSVHPTNATHEYIAQDFATKAPTLFV